MTQGPLLPAIRASVGASSVGVSQAVAALGTFGLAKYCADQSVAEEIRNELARRRRTIRTSLAPNLQAALVLPEAGLYGCLLVDSYEEENRIRSDLASRDVLLTPGQGLSNGYLGSPFLRFCVGATSRLADAFEQIDQVVSQGCSSGRGANS